MTRYTPGVQYFGSPTALNPWDNFAVSDFSVRGSKGRSEFLLDGIPNMRIDLVSFSLSPDAVSEKNIQTNAYGAEYGHSSKAFVNVSTKGGTNDVHGTTETMDVEIVHDPTDRLGLWVCHSQMERHLRELSARPAGRDIREVATGLGLYPAEDIGCPTTLILVVPPGFSSVCGGGRQAGHRHAR